MSLGMPLHSAVRESQSSKPEQEPTIPFNALAFFKERDSSRNDIYDSLFFLVNAFKKKHISTRPNLHLYFGAVADFSQ